MGRRIARANIFNKTSPWTRAARYDYIIIGEKPINAIINAQPAFPGNATPGTYLWEFNESIGDGTQPFENEHADARPFGIQVTHTSVDYLSPAHYNDTFVSVFFETTPRIGYADSLRPVVRWTKQTTIEQETDYIDLDGESVANGFSRNRSIIRYTATADSWIHTGEGAEGQLNADTFKYHLPGQVMFVGSSGDIVHGDAASPGHGRGVITWEFLAKYSGWDHREVQRDDDGVVLLTQLPDGTVAPLYRQFRTHRRTEFAPFFAGLEAGPGILPM